MIILSMNWFQKNILNVDGSLHWRWNEHNGRKVDRNVSRLERFFKKYIGSTWACSGIRVVRFEPFIFNKHHTIFLWGTDVVLGITYREILGINFKFKNHVNIH